MKKNKGVSAGKVAAIAAGTVALGAAAYYFLGPKGKQHQASAKKWAVDAKKKIIHKIQDAKEMTKSLYENIVDDVLKPYIANGATSAEVMAFGKALKNDWTHIVRASKATVKKTTSPSKGKKAPAKKTQRKKSNSKK